MKRTFFLIIGLVVLLISNLQSQNIIQPISDDMYFVFDKTIMEQGVNLSSAIMSVIISDCYYPDDMPAGGFVDNFPANYNMWSPETQLKSGFIEIIISGNHANGHAYIYFSGTPSVVHVPINVYEHPQEVIHD